MSYHLFVVVDLVEVQVLMCLMFQTHCFLGNGSENWWGFELWLGGSADMFGCEFDETTKMAGRFKLYVIGSDG